ncbi:MAG: sterol desaturase/sphingolipid hydroxylase (fatty acid hydroxylase superfamily) [Hyphomicrobiaceae bacterium]|jgi:sterol desaturase/sphingolipid hydroxylase (fatty acid hydroxylase superfamily)
MPDAGGLEAIWRIGAFIAVFAIMAALESVSPKRRLTYQRLTRWRTNFGIVLLGSLAVRAMAMLPGLLGAAAVPLVAVSAAFLAADRGWGLLNTVALPAWLEIIVTLLVLDFAIWLQHLASHKIPMLWRLHRMHHADVEFDVTTAIRFHPIEIALSMLYKVLWVLVLGPSVLAVIIFEVILSSCALFNHANVALPLGLDRLLRTLIVTPDMHRVHHSTEQAEHDTNYGFNLSVWDRLFATYKAQPDAGHVGMTIGLKPYQSDAPTRFGWSLWLPFK